MSLYYLKATDRDALWAALESAELAEKRYDPLDEDNQEPDDADADWQPTGAYEWSAKECDLDEIGTLHEETGVTEEVDGMEVPVTEALEGYHANLNATLTKAQKDLLPLVKQPPRTPKRKWLGVE